MLIKHERFIAVQLCNGNVYYTLLYYRSFPFSQIALQHSWTVQIYNNKYQPICEKMCTMWSHIPFTWNVHANILQKDFIA